LRQLLAELLKSVSDFMGKALAVPEESHGRKPATAGSL
jgi:hypothetical protein